MRADDDHNLCPRPLHGYQARMLPVTRCTFRRDESRAGANREQVRVGDNFLLLLASR